MFPGPPDRPSARAGGLLPPGAPSFDGDDRFEIRSTLGRGTSSVVYRAFDRQRGAEVALKVLGVQGSAGMLAFKREFRSMADVAHPNLVKLYELYAAGDDLMFTMELVDGSDFLGYVRRPVGAAPRWTSGTARPPAPERDTMPEWSGAAPDRVPIDVSGELSYFPPLHPEQLPTLRTITAQLVRGLMALHEVGHVHRDVKPSNVMVDDSGRAVVLDFGVSAELAGYAQAAGTPAYMSPEQAQGERPSPPADFYGVGVMLYEALTGRLPHAGDDPVRDKLQRDPGPPSMVAAGVPVDLDRLCQALLARDPALRPEGPAILDLLCGDTERTLTPRSRTETTLVGRDDELARVRAAIARVTEGEGQVVFVTGRSGIGKSVMLRHLLARQRRQGAVVLTGRCYEQESVPYKALDAVMDAICQHLAAMPAHEREEVMPRHRWALGRLFPVLAQFAAPAADARSTETEARPTDSVQEIRQRQTIPVSPRQEPGMTRATAPIHAPPRLSGGPSSSSDPRLLDASLAARSTVVVGAPMPAEVDEEALSTDPARIRRQGVGALRQLLEALATHAPLIIAIDDMQWGDVDSAQVLAEVLAPPQPPLLMLGAYRSEDEITSDFLRHFLPAQPSHDVIELHALPPDAALALATTLIPGPSEAGASEVAAEAKGDPFLLVELARHVAGQQGPKPSARGLTVEVVVRDRIGQLDAPARRLLEAIAVAAGPVARSVARRAADIGAEESTAMVQLRAAHLLRVKGTRGVEVIEVYHDRIREAVIEQLSDDQRCRWHLRLVTAMQAEGHLDHERIGKHLEAGGHPEQAVPHYLEAAEASSRTLAFDRSADLYRRGLSIGGFDPRDEVRLRNEYADVLMRQARFDEAAGELQRALEKLGAGVDRARLYHKLGEVELGRGDVPAAAAALEHALDELGEPVPRGRSRLLLSNLREIAVQLRHTYFPAPPRAPATENERLAMRVYSRLAHAYYFSRGGMQVYWPHLRELNAAERHPPTPELGRAYAGHGRVLAVLPWFRRGLSYVDRSLEIQRRLGDRWGEAQALHQQGVVLYAASRFAEAARVSTVAAEQLEHLGDAVEAYDALLHAAMAMLQLGRSAEASGMSRRVHNEALDAGDMFAAAKGLVLWTLASGGRVPSMMIQVQIDIAAQIDQHYTMLLALLANGLRLLGAGRLTDAARSLDRTAKQLRDTGVLSTELLSDLDTWRTTAWRRVAEHADDPVARHHALRQARRALRRALWSTARFRNGLPHALREAGRLATLAGHHRRARVLLDASLAVAVRHEQAEQVAMTRRVRGRRPGDVGSAEDRSPACKGLLRLEGDPAG
ncbi:MAG: BREX system ATP-binding domain-containing protein [Nannocystaceae bacterium]